MSSEAVDPDRDQLEYLWWQYSEAGTCPVSVDILGAETKEAILLVPQNAEKGQTIHIVLEVKDQGSPPLTRFARVIVTVH